MNDIINTYKAVFNPDKNKGVFAISLVHDPAMEGNFIALSEQEVKLATVNEEERILIGLVMQPDLPIYRNQEDGEFNIVFDSDTIKELSYHFFKTNSQKNSTIEHDGSNIEGVTFVESWIVENSEVDKSVNFGLSYPKGSWLATMKVDSDEIWNDYVKTGKVQGFSIDAFVTLEKINNNNNLSMSKEENKSLIDAIKELPSKLALALAPKEEEQKIEFGSVQTADGSVTIEFEGDMLEVDKQVYVIGEDGERIALPSGSYEIEGNKTITVSEESIVVEITDVEEVEEVEEAEASTEEASTELSQTEEFEKVMLSAFEKYETKLTEVTEKLESLTTENKELKEELVNLKNEPAAKEIKATVSQKVDLSKLSTKGRIIENLKK